MAWTEITRRKNRRDGLRYASHLTDAEWALIEPLLPPASPLGRPRETKLRAAVNAILYMASTGCQWRLLPKEFPPYSTVQSYFYAWSRCGVFADGGYAGDKLRAAVKGKGSWTLQIIKRLDAAKGFEVLPRRWVVERTFAWLGRCRRLAKDFEAMIASAVAWVLVANIRTLRGASQALEPKRNHFESDSKTVSGSTHFATSAGKRASGIWSSPMTEPPRVCRRLFRLSHAANAGSTICA